MALQIDTQKRRFLSRWAVGAAVVTAGVLVGARLGGSEPAPTEATAAAGAPAVAEPAMPASFVDAMDAMLHDIGGEDAPLAGCRSTDGDVVTSEVPAAWVTYRSVLTTPRYEFRHPRDWDIAEADNRVSMHRGGVSIEVGPVGNDGTTLDDLAAFLADAAPSAGLGVESRVAVRTEHGAGCRIDLRGEDGAFARLYLLDAAGATVGVAVDADAVAAEDAAAAGDALAASLRVGRQ